MPRNDFFYRPMEHQDLEQVMVIENQCFSMPWSMDSMRKELEENASFARYFVALDEDRVIGYAGYWQVFDEAHITNIAVHPSYRRQGVAWELLKKLETEFPARGILYSTLEVRVSNEPAKALYLQNGFYEAGVRPRYYEKPVEDASIMWKNYQEK